MIDSDCPIWKEGRGFCWAPSSAWGCTDLELCAKCQAKPRPAKVQALILPGSMLLGKNEENQVTIVGAKTSKPMRICRFCQRPTGFTYWSKERRMCRRRECWDKFIREMKLAV